MLAFKRRRNRKRDLSNCSKIMSKVGTFIAEKGSSLVNKGPCSWYDCVFYGTPCGVVKVQIPSNPCGRSVGSSLKHPGFLHREGAMLRFLSTEAKIEKWAMLGIVTTKIKKERNFCWHIVWRVYSVDTIGID